MIQAPLCAHEDPNVGRTGGTQSTHRAEEKIDIPAWALAWSSWSKGKRERRGPGVRQSRVH